MIAVYLKLPLLAFESYDWSLVSIDKNVSQTVSNVSFILILSATIFNQGIKVNSLSDHQPW